MTPIPGVEPTPAAKRALEFAEYMAKNAEQLLDALNEHAAALMALEDYDPDVDDIDAAVARSELAEQGLGEDMQHLSSSIYEFRKRAAKAGGLPS